MLRKKNVLVVLLAVIMPMTFIGCRHDRSGKTAIEENRTAKRLLQGIWLNEDEEDVAFRIKGDTVYFPDSTSVPAYFRVERDSFVVAGANVMRYKIVKQTPHVFVFVNQNGERVKLVKTTDNSYSNFFSKTPPVSVNQNRLLKSDTVVFHGDSKYHSYVQVNPTTFKVVKATINDDGVEVGNVYYDNIIHLGIFKGAEKLFSSDFHKKDFSREVPERFLQQAVLSDLTFIEIDANGFHYFAVLAIPDTSISYMVEVVVGFDGKLTKRIKK